MSFVDKKGIVVASGFKLQAETLLDVRQQVDTIEERDELVTIHAATAGLRVFVKDKKKSYVYDGSDWQELTTGAGYTHPTGDGNHHVPATGTSNNGKVLMAGSTAGSEYWKKLSKSDISDFPEELPNPSVLTISLNGTSQGAYDGSSAKNIDITPDSIGASEDGHTHSYAGSSTVGGAANSVKASLVVKLNGGSAEGTNMFTFNGSTAKSINITPGSIGAAASSHDHTVDDITDFEDSVAGLIPEIPTKLPNPQAITFTGAVSETYDGSAAKTINIPTSGSTDGDLIIKFNHGNQEGTNMFTFNGSDDKTVDIVPSSIGAAGINHSHTTDNITDFDSAVEALIPSSLPTANSLVVKLNGGTEEGTNMFTFNGSAAKSINITPSSIGAAATDHNHSAANITSGILAVARGGTGITANPSMLVNLGSTAAASVFAASPRPGITGTLPIANGGTGATSASAARTALGITPANIGAATSSHDHTVDDITDFEESVTGLIPEIPTKLPNPQAITFTGAVSATYDGSAAKTINIPTSGSTDGKLIVKLNGGTSEGTNMFTFNGSADKTINVTASGIGAAATSHTHTHDKITDFDDAVEDLLPSIPTSLPNPAALTISLNGTSQGAYTGSAAKSINITASSIGAAASSHSHSLASTSAAGYLRQLNGSTSQFMRGDGTWATPPNTTYSNMTGASTSAAGKAGLVPAPAAGAANRYLRSDGTWQVPPDTKTTLSSLGITATADEINKLDGITATKDEINFLDGVTSAIQTQLNGKASSSHTHNYAGSSSAGGAANSVKTSLIVKLNGGTTEGTNMFTFNGSAAKTVNITPSSIGAAAASHGTHVTYSTNAPLAAGTASAGSAATVARSDHRHPLQTTVSGNAGTATKLATARTISLTGDVTGSASFDGSANASIAAVVKNHLYTDIPSNSDLNDYTDPGWYRCAANATVDTLDNAPTSNAFVLIVNTHAGTNQLLIEYTTTLPRIWTRNLYQSAWGSWARLYSTLDKPTASEVGAATSSHNHAASNITSGTLPVARGGTGITANPSMLVNLGSTAAASVFAASPRPGVTGTLPIAKGGTGATSAAAARTALGITPANIGAAATSHTHNYAGSSSAGGAATSANKVNVPVGTVLFSTSSSSTFFSSCFGGTWTVVGNVDASINGTSTLTLYMFRKTAA